MTVLSKNPIPYNCYEVGHTWDSSCHRTWINIAIKAFIESFKIYATLYSVATLVRKPKFSFSLLLRLFREVVQSSSFLACTGFGFIALLCLTRRTLGAFHFISAAYIPSFIASFLSILIERKSRRGILTVYVVNVASETLFRMASARGLVRELPHSNLMLFSFTMAIFMYLYRNNLTGHDYVTKIIRFIIGPNGVASNKNLHMNGESSSSRVNNSSPKSRISKFEKFLPISVLLKFTQTYLLKLRALPRHITCPHCHSCMYHISSGFTRAFFIGYGVQTVLKLVTSLPKIVRNPNLFISALKNKQNFQFGLFLGSYAGIYKVIMCLLRWIRNIDDPRHTLPAGFIAGISSTFYPSITFTMHIFWKLVEVLYGIGAKAGYLPSYHLGLLLLYSASTAVLFHAAAIEPHSLKPAYWQFLQRLSGGKIGMLNHELLEVFGTNSMSMFPNQKIYLDKRYVSDVFKEYLKSKGGNTRITLF